MDRIPLHAMLTGDVTPAARLSAEGQVAVETALRESHLALNEAFDGAFALAIELLPGTGWQMLTSNPRIALRAALHFRAELKARMGSHHLDSRIAIGVGAVDRPPVRKVSDGDGPAYRRARNAFEGLHRSRRLALRLEDQPLSPGFDEMLGLVDHVAGRWTDKQALAITGALQNWTQERIAGGWNRLGERAVSQQTVAQHLHRAGWHALAPAVDFLEGLLA